MRIIKDNGITKKTTKYNISLEEIKELIAADLDANPENIEVSYILGNEWISEDNCYKVVVCIEVVVKD